MMRKLMIMITITAGAVMGGTAALPGTAGAAIPSTASVAASNSVVTATTPSCPSGYFCVWYLQNYVGAEHQWFGNDSNWTNDYFYNGYSVNDNDESWSNHGTACSGCDRIHVYHDINYRGGITISLARGQSVPVNTGAQDTGSSHLWY